MRAMRFSRVALMLLRWRDLLVAQALPTLALSPADQQGCAGPHRPDYRRLKALGGSLRTILEGAAGNVLAAVLPGLWHP